VLFRSRLTAGGVPEAPERCEAVSELGLIRYSKARDSKARMVRRSMR
jgi:hypothetical protein